MYGYHREKLPVDLIWEFNFHEWPRQNFSLQYQYNVNQVSYGIKKIINLGIINWSNTKFSEPTL